MVFWNLDFLKEEDGGWVLYSFSFIGNEISFHLFQKRKEEEEEDA